VGNESAERKEKARVRAAEWYAANRQLSIQKRKEYHEENRVRDIARSKAYHAANREKVNARRKEHYWVHRDETLIKQRIRSRQRYWEQKAIRESEAPRPKPSHCEVCGGNSGGIVWDHCHVKKQFRGWLCSPCNTALGLVKDNVIVLEKLIKYLKFGGIYG
jgi:hypothetical protein